MNMRTAVSLVPALMVARAPLSLKVATNVPALPATQVLDALTTRMNVLPHLLSAKMKASASTHLAPTSKDNTRNKICHYYYYFTKYSV